LFKSSSFLFSCFSTSSLGALSRKLELLSFLFKNSISLLSLSISLLTLAVSCEISIKSAKGIYNS